MSNIKSMSIYDRPREKAKLLGIDSLSNSELIALLISTGTKDKSAIDISNDLLTKFNGVNGIIRAHINELCELKGINYAKALRLHAGLILYERAILEERILNINLKGVDSIGSYFVAKIGNAPQEIGYLVIVDNKERVIKITELFKGQKSKMELSSKILLRNIIGQGNKFYLIHNHPSNNLVPSRKDLEFTGQLEMTCLSLGIEFLDHIIVGKETYLSINQYRDKNNGLF